MPFAPPDIRWPHQGRGGRRFDEALRVGNSLGDEAGLAYIHAAALLVELELSNAREGSSLHSAATDFLIALERLSGA